MTGRLRVRTALTAVVAAAAVLAPVGATPTSAQSPPAPQPPLVAPAAPLLDAVPPGWPQPPTIDAAAWVLVDVETGQVVAEHRGDQRRAVASTVKILTALTAVRRTELDEVVTVGDEVLGLEGASIQLQPGDELTVEQLLLGTLVRSGNDAAEALATHVAGDAATFVELMRDDAATLGLEVGGGDGAQLRSVSGLDDANQLSARDLAVLGRAALADPDLARLFVVEEVDLPRVGTDDNRNRLVDDYPGATGIKTGFTAEAGNSLVGSARRGQRELLVVVLDAGDDPARFSQATALLDHGFGAFARAEPDATRTLLVAGGRRTVTATAPPVTVPSDAAVTVTVPVPPRLSDLGSARLRVGERVVADLPTWVDGAAPPPVDDAAAVGRGAVEGVHAALRATLAANMS